MVLWFSKRLRGFAGLYSSLHLHSFDGRKYFRVCRNVLRNTSNSEAVLLNSATIRKEPDHLAADNEEAEKSLYPEIIPSPLEKGLPAIKHERKHIGDFVRRLPTIQEKIDFVNPYERPWLNSERKRHRANDPRLSPPRKAYYVPAAPSSYNLLPFYKFITKTHTVNGLPECYDAINVDQETEQFSKALKDCFDEAFDADFGRNNPHFEEYPVNVVIDLMCEVGLQMFSADFKHLRTAQVSRNARTECFWICGGFHRLYDQEKWSDPEKRRGLRKLIGDDRRIRGELVMFSKEKPALQILTELPLPEIVPLNDSVCYTDVPEYLYSPKALGLMQSEDPLWMVPGFEVDSRDPCEFGLLSICDSSKVYERCRRQRCEKDEGEVEESLLSMGIINSFSWLVGQSHAQGFTQYNEMDYPLVSQTILTDGRSFYFLVYQLNTLSMINYWDNQEKPCNICWYHGPIDLFQLDSSKRIVEWDKDNIVKHFLKLLLNQPRTRDYEMKPFLDKDQSVPCKTEDTSKSSISQFFV